MLGMFRSEEVGQEERGGYRDFLMLLSLRVARVTLYLVVLVHIPLYLSMGVIVSSLILSRNTPP